MIVNNYYIRDKEEGWKHTKQSEISPNTSRSHTQIKSSEISPNETTLEVTTNEISKTLEEPLLHDRKGTEVRPRGGPDLRAMRDPQRFHAEELEIQNTASPTTECYNQPPTTRTEGNTETAAMLDCIHQLQLTLKEHVLLNSKQAEYQMSQNADLFSEMIRGQNR